MTNAKFYLNVPYAEKDQAKALGARWDASRKKWYVPAGVDVSLFQQWEPADVAGDGKAQAVTGTPSRGRAAGVSSKASGDSVGGAVVAQTQPADKHFVPYCGEAPPWD
ncbi:DUF5710 domain-containing protein [Methylogaea oryzae]|uniref:DUF5710 domain-containing protein n=1 Tax=Methylogaea oryzae TaxID=1295382 RepID=A0A8D5ALX1_9GAMM|nr:DUF5710 domain-containing protein [Methylogaea oryzae]BBL72571.1 hypothetical protein MoryE10_31770 [Methylogaea oryzae]